MCLSLIEHKSPILSTSHLALVHSDLEINYSTVVDLLSEGDRLRAELEHFDNLHKTDEIIDTTESAFSNIGLIHLKDLNESANTLNIFGQPEVRL